MTPDAFPRDWYGWLTNQVSHIGLGLFLVWATSLVAYVLAGEFPYRWGVWWLIFVTYTLHELFAQRWHGWDTVEDILFVVFYSAGGTLLAFVEFEAGLPYVIFDLVAPLPILATCICHLVVGSIVRWVRANG